MRKLRPLGVVSLALIVWCAPLYASEDDVTWTSRVERNLPLFFLGTLLSGFLAGLTAYKFLLEATNQTTLVKGTYILKSNVVGRVLKNEALTEVRSMIDKARLIKPSEDPNEAEAFLTKAQIFVHGLDLEKIRHPSGDFQSVASREIDLIVMGDRDGYNDLTLDQKLSRVVGVLSGLESSFVSTAGQAE